MIAALATLLLFQLIGEALAQFSGLPIPGPVIGMLLLALLLGLRRHVPSTLGQVADTLLSHLSLLFVPAGVGVIQYLGRFADEWPAIIAALLLSTLLSIAMTALAMRAVLHYLKRRNGPDIRG